jgi:hypothetical protein
VEAATVAEMFGTIRHILTNPVYTGTVYAGRNHYRQATGRISPLNLSGEATAVLSACRQKTGLW